MWRLLFFCTFRDDDRERSRDRDRDDKRSKDDKSKSIFEQFNIPKPQLQINPFTGSRALYLVCQFIFTANPGGDQYKPLWKLLQNLLIIFQSSFQNQWWIGKLTLNLWKNLRADFIYLHFILHQWLVYKISVISTSHVTIQGTCWKWNYLLWFYCEEIMNIDFDEDKRKLPTKSFLKYLRELSPYLMPNQTSLSYQHFVLI